MPAWDFVVMIPIGNDDLAAANVKWIATHPHYYGLSARNHHSFFFYFAWVHSGTRDIFIDTFLMTIFVCFFLIV